MSKALDVWTRNDFLLTPSDSGGDGVHVSVQICHLRWTGETSQSSQCWCDWVSALWKRPSHLAGACKSAAVMKGDVAEQRQLLAGVSVSFAKNFGEKGMVKRWHSLTDAHVVVAGVPSEQEQGSVHLLTGVRTIHLRLGFH